MGNGGADREHRGAELYALSGLSRPVDNLAEVAHDARNMVTALALYCELLKQPGVLHDSFRHYAGELQLVTAASRRLVDKLSQLDGGVPETALPEGPAASVSARRTGDGERAAAALADPEATLDARRSMALEAAAAAAWHPCAPPQPIDNLAEHLSGLCSLLRALTGPLITLHIHCEGGQRGVYMSQEDLTRVLVNLVKNAGEAMPQGGRIDLHLEDAAASKAATPMLLLRVEDNGPGLPPGELQRLAEPAAGRASEPWTRMTAQGRRGLGLAITRTIVEASGGRIRARNGVHGGACLAIELPVRA